MVESRRDEQLVWNRRHWRMVPSTACLVYSMGHVDEAPSLLGVADCLGVNESLRQEYDWNNLLAFSRSNFSSSVSEGPGEGI